MVSHCPVPCGPSSASLSAQVTAPHGGPNRWFHLSTGQDGKEGLKPASASLLYRAASRSFFQHKRNEIQLSRLLAAACCKNPAALCRRTPGGHQAVLIKYTKINKGDTPSPGTHCPVRGEKQKQQGRNGGREREAPRAAT